MIAKAASLFLLGLLRWKSAITFSFLFDSFWWEVVIVEWSLGFISFVYLLGLQLGLVIGLVVELDPAKDREKI